MRYHYKTGVIVPFAQKFYKQLTIAIAGLFLASVAVLTLGASAHSLPKWKAVAGSPINFSCLGNGSIFVHTLDTVVKGDNGNFTGTGHFNADPLYTWNIAGNIAGNAFSFAITYTGKEAPYVYNAVNGVIASDGSGAAGVTDVNHNCQSLSLPAGSFRHKLQKEEIDISGNTGTEDQKGAWMFNRDASTSTPFEFTTAQKTLDKGSLFVKPIGATPANKFIGEYFARESVATFDSFSYDFKIAGPTGDAADANQFYVNFYVTLTNGTNFRDCRFDYVPSVGSTTSFTTFTVNKNTVANAVGDPVDSFSCPTTLAGMPAGSYIRAIAINVGDTSASDTGLAGYLDKAVFTTTTKKTVYDLEPKKHSKDDCKKDGWRNLRDDDDKRFKNQGDCVSHCEHNDHHDSHNRRDDD